VCVRGGGGLFASREDSVEREDSKGALCAKVIRNSFFIIKLY